MYYQLINHKIKKISDTESHEVKYKDVGKKVFSDDFKIDGKTIRVSTVFIGLSISVDPKEDKPALFETMIFGGKHNHVRRRCCTYDEAIEQHKKLSAKVTV